MLHPRGARRLSIGLVLAVVLGAAGAIVTPLEGEAAIMGRVVELRSATLTTWMHLVTTLGDLWFVVLVALAVAVAVRRSRDARSIRVLLFASIAGSALIVSILKLLVVRPRPAEALLPTLTSAYPSGHATRAVAVHGLIAWSCYRYVRHPLLRSVGATLGVLLAAAIILSRLYLGVHLPSEVVAGGLLGGIWLVVVLRSVRLPASGPQCPGPPEGAEGT